MTERISEHEWRDGICLQAPQGSVDANRSCVFRDAPPRPVPQSIFAGDLGEIGERMKAIRAEEGREVVAGGCRMTWFLLQMLGFLTVIVKVPAAVKALAFLERPIEIGITNLMNRRIIADIKKTGIRHR